MVNVPLSNFISLQTGLIHFIPTINTFNFILTTNIFSIVFKIQLVVLEKLFLDFYTTFYLTYNVRRKNFCGSTWKFAPRGSFLRRSRIWHYFFDPGPGSRLTGPSIFSLKLALFLELSNHISGHIKSSETGSKAFLWRIIYWIKII